MGAKKSKGSWGEGGIFGETRKRRAEKGQPETTGRTITEELHEPRGPALHYQAGRKQSSWVRRRERRDLKLGSN